MFSKRKIGHQQHCCYCDSHSVRLIRGFTYSGIEHLVCEAHLNKLKTKIINDSDVARRMIDAHGIESITDVVSVNPDILKELLYGDEHTIERDITSSKEKDNEQFRLDSV